MPAVLPVTAFTPPARRLANAAVLFVAGFLVIRTVCLEPFGVPTGSMAPALLGNHREAYCPRCDFRVVVGDAGPATQAGRRDRCRCPNCGQSVDLAAAAAIPGDRLLVDKTVFHARLPRRWELVVFRCRADGFKPYVKRVVGLPGERLEVADGDVYADGRLLRKSLAQVRETRVAVFDYAHAPAAGWGERFRTQADGGAETPPGDGVVTAAALCLPAGVGLTYRHVDLDTRTEGPVTDEAVYNGAADRGGFARGDGPLGRPVHDFCVTFELDLGTGPFAVRLADGSSAVRADFWPGAGMTLTADGGPESHASTGLTLAAGATYRVEFALTDRRASLAVNGVEAVVPLDLAADPPGRSRRGGVSRPVQFGATGPGAVVRGLKLYRDVHYTDAATVSGWPMPAGEYFVLGDNSPNSHDSRGWETDGKPDPGVPAGALIGKPFLVHQPLRLARLPGTRGLAAPDWSRLRWVR